MMSPILNTVLNRIFLINVYDGLIERYKKVIE